MIRISWSDVMSDGCEGCVDRRRCHRRQIVVRQDPLFESWQAASPMPSKEWSPIILKHIRCGKCTDAFNDQSMPQIVLSGYEAVAWDRGVDGRTNDLIANDL